MTATWTAPRTWVNDDLITAGEVNTDWRDNLEFLRGAPFATVSDLDGTVFSTASTTFVDVTGATATFTTAGTARLYVFVNGSANSGGTANTVYLTLTVDGANVGHSTLGLQYLSQAGVSPFGFTYLTSNLSAGSHTVKLQMRVSSGTRTLNLLTFTVSEVL
jgi:hypothetical protein